MLNQKIKDFWIRKINELKYRKGVASNLLVANDGNADDTVWQKKINDLEHWDEIEDFALEICEDIYNKATATNTGDVWPNNWGGKMDKLADNSDGDSARDEYWSHVWKTLRGFETFILKNYKGVNLTERENQIKNALNRDSADVIPNNWDNDVKTFLTFLVNDLGVDLDKLPTIPATEDLNSLLARPTQTELDKVEGWKDDLEKGFREILEMAPTDALPNNFDDLADLYLNKSGNKTVIQLKTKADDYDRIHTKLNGKVSDTELDNLLNGVPSCSHSDYDSIKSERDTLKTENTQLKEHQCDCASKVAEKETQIITKIITDLQLSTERERENVLEAVITEIKTKLAPPADNSADKQKIIELETKITNLQAPKSLTDLPISQEVKAEVIKISQELGLTAQSCAKLEKASSYQELSNLQKEAFQEKLNSEISSKDSAQTMNYCLGALSIGSLLLLFWILIKKTTFTPEIGSKEKKE